MIWHTYVPSKGRATTCKAPNWATIVVEPHEAVHYRANGFNRLLVLPESDKGLANTRNFIKEYATERGEEWFWMVDDDVSSYGVVINSRNKKEEAEKVYIEAQRIITEGNAAQGAMEYGQYAWSSNKEFRSPGYCDVVVAINTLKTKGLKYRKEVTLKEDRDMTLQILSLGLKVVRASHCWFSSPENGSNAGGLQSEYATDNRELEAVNEMVKLWPGIVSHQVKKNGRNDCKIDWKKAELYGKE